MFDFEGRAGASAAIAGSAPTSAGCMDAGESADEARGRGRTIGGSGDAGDGANGSGEFSTDGAAIGGAVGSSAASAMDGAGGWASLACDLGLNSTLPGSPPRDSPADG